VTHADPRRTIWTVGHSNVDADALLNALHAAGIDRLVDVRMFPRSRRHPHFNQDRLAATLKEAGIEYTHMPSLGGRRTPREDSINRGLRDEGFRGFADYMSTRPFEAALRDLVRGAGEGRTAIMCAESLPWRCHRSLIADALTARGLRVVHLVGGGEREHQLTAAAKVERRKVTYPALL
jgi:uncharacterized protein (DUF488 family)